jgi:hypothetical protein
MKQQGLDALAAFTAIHVVDACASWRRIAMERKEGKGERRRRRTERQGRADRDNPCPRWTSTEKRSNMDGVWRRSTLLLPVDRAGP